MSLAPTNEESAWLNEEKNHTAGFTIFPSFVTLVHKNCMWTITCLVVGLAMSPLALADL
jgi:hypothetical protein